MPKAAGRKKQKAGDQNTMFGGSSSAGPSRSSRGRRRITEEEWMQQKDIIEQLYLEEGKDVKEVRNIMIQDHDFEAQ
jgi:hypothetical protein